MTSDEKLEKIWAWQLPDEHGKLHPVLYERCHNHAEGWRLYFWSTVGGGHAIATKGSPSLAEAVDAAYAKLFPVEAA